MAISVGSRPLVLREAEEARRAPEALHRPVPRDVPGAQQVARRDRRQAFGRNRHEVGDGAGLRAGGADGAGHGAGVAPLRAARHHLRVRRAACQGAVA